MFKTIFRKQLILYFSVIAFSLLFLGIFFANIYKDKILTEKIAMLQQQGYIISHIISPYWLDINHFLIEQKVKTDIQIELSKIQDYINAKVFITDSNFYTQLRSPNTPDNLNQKTLTFENMDKVQNGKLVSFIGNFNGLFDDDHLNIIVPIVSENYFIGTVVISVSLTDLYSNYNSFVKTTIIFLFIIAFIAFIIIYFTSLNMSKRLLNINNAAKVIADGNFEKRINIINQDEIAQLAVSFNEMAESLEKNDQKSRDFITSVSHDLRSPLTSMNGFLNAILDGTIPAENQNRYLNIVLEETQRLTKLTNDLIVLSKLKTFGDPIIYKEFDLNELIRTTYISLEDRFEKKQLNISIILAQEKTIINADSDKIQRVVYNLLENAIKFSTESNEIIIETNVDIDFVYVSIKDNGIGLDEDEQKRIFDRFYKVDSSRGENKEGSGVGLSIVKELVHGHNGEVFIESEIGKGCNFTFKLPLGTRK